MFVSINCMFCWQLTNSWNSKLLMFLFHFFGSSLSTEGPGCGRLRPLWHAWSVAAVLWGGQGTCPQPSEAFWKFESFCGANGWKQQHNPFKKEKLQVQIHDIGCQWCNDATVKVAVAALYGLAKQGKISMDVANQAQLGKKFCLVPPENRDDHNVYVKYRVFTFSLCNGGKKNQDDLESFSQSVSPVLDFLAFPKAWEVWRLSRAQGHLHGGDPLSTRQAS